VQGGTQLAPHRPGQVLDVRKLWPGEAAAEATLERPEQRPSRFSTPLQKNRRRKYMTVERGGTICVTRCYETACSARVTYLSTGMPSGGSPTPTSTFI
jgi:hypothetical protein